MDRFRVPGWSRGVSVKVNGVEQNVSSKPETWAVIARAWQPGDQVGIRIPLPLMRKRVDEQHPNRVAIMRGPVVLVQEGGAHFPLPLVPEKEADLEKWLAPEETPGVFRIFPQDDVPVRGNFLPFCMVKEVRPYRMYFDPALRRGLW
jgi:hypothetical protein